MRHDKNRPRTPGTSRTPRTRHRLPAWATMAALLAATLTVASAPEPAESTEHVLTIDSSSARPTEPFQPFDAYPLETFDFDGDGDQEIVTHNDNRFVYVFDSRDGRLLAELETTYPEGWAARSLNGPQAGVLVNGGVPHLVVANSAAFVTLFRFEADHSGDGHLAFSRVWEQRLDGCGEPDPSMDSRPVLADLDDDGRDEIVAYTEKAGGYALRSDGNRMWEACIGGGNAAPVVADLDDSGTKQVVFVSDGGELTVADARTGETQWTFRASDPQFNLDSASIPVSAAVGQIDGEGPLDVVFGARDSHDDENYGNNNAALFAVSGHGDLIWMRQHPQANPLTYTIPVIHDVDDDGANDIIWGDWNTIGQKAGIPEEDWWQVTGPANFYRYDAEGDLRWHQQMDTYWSNKNLPLADVDGDGVQEVLANAPSDGGDGIWYLDSVTGEKEQFVSVHPWKVNRAPVVADLWGTGTMQWVVAVEADDEPVSGGALLVFDTHQDLDSAWPAPPSDGDLDASFRTPGGNGWWVEVHVEADGPLDSVHARADGGPWVELEEREWGAWAGSFHVEGGSVVEFRARGTGGDNVVSDGYVWPSGDPA